MLWQVYCECGVTDRKVKDCYYVSTDQIAEIRDLTSYQATENIKKQMN